MASHLVDNLEALSRTNLGGSLQLIKASSEDAFVEA